MRTKKDPINNESYLIGMTYRQRKQPIESNPYPTLIFDYYLFCAGWNDHDIALTKNTNV